MYHRTLVENVMGEMVETESSLFAFADVAAYAASITDHDIIGGFGGCAAFAYE